jgi:hypothetical protein
MIRNYRSQLPFGDEALAQIRKDVLTQIEREQRVERRWLGLFLRATLAASVLVFLVSLPLLRRPDRKPTITPAVSPVPQPPQPPAQLATRNPQPDPAPTPPRPARRRPRPIERIEPPEVVRIELHTSDPDVRIIWFTNHTGETR